MPFLKKLKLNYFQGHKKTVLNFDKGVNIIHGISMAGKSSIIRALEQLAFNTPIKFEYHSDFTKKKRSSIQAFFGIGFQDGNNVKLTNDGKTKYSCNDNKPYEAFGHSIPDEVKEICNLDPINFSYQFDSPFLVKKPTELAREINRVTKQDVINKWIKTANKKVSKCKSKIGLLTEEKEKEEKRLEKFKGLRLAHPYLIKAKIAAKKLEALNLKLETLNEINERMKQINKIISKSGTSIEQLEKIYKKINRAEHNIERSKKSISVLKSYSEINKVIKFANREMENLKRDYMKSLGDRCRYCFQKISPKQRKRISEKL